MKRILLIVFGVVIGLGIGVGLNHVRATGYSQLAQTQDGSSVSAASSVFSDNGLTGLALSQAGQIGFKVCVPAGRGLNCSLATGTDEQGQRFTQLSGWLSLDTPLIMNGIQVLGPQGPAIPDSDGSEADNTRAINAILAQMRSDGKIAQ